MSPAPYRPTGPTTEVRDMELNINGTKYELDKTCEMCKKAYEALISGKIPKGKAVVINPSTNAFGVTTHYHVGLIDY